MPWRKSSGPSAAAVMTRSASSKRSARSSLAGAPPTGRWTFGATARSWSGRSIRVLVGVRDEAADASAAGLVEDGPERVDGLVEAIAGSGDPAQPLVSPPAVVLAPSA